jgi:hypothetical protein
MNKTSKGGQILRGCLLFISILFLFIPEMASAQAYYNKSLRPRPEIYFQVGGGPAGLQYSLSKGGSTMKLGAKGGLGILFFVSNHIGINLGLDFSAYHTNASLDNTVMLMSPELDPEKVPFEWRVLAGGYEEEQTAQLVAVPVTIQGQWPLYNTINLYAQAGIRFGFPLNISRYKSKAAFMITSGYYPETATELANMPQRGFGEIKDWQRDGTLDLAISYSAMLEAGAKFQLGERVFAYTGLYFEYGLNTIRGDVDKPFINYQPDDIYKNTTSNSLIKSTALVGEDVHLMSYGIILRLSIALSSSGNNSMNSTSKSGYKCYCQ